MVEKLVYDGTLKAWVTLEVNDDLVNESLTKKNKIQDVRLRRDMLLQESDWTMTSDSPLTDSQKDEAKTYRQSLRDLPAHNEFPNNTFPTKPSFIK